jgi:hypothetical protein
VLVADCHNHRSLEIELGKAEPVHQAPVPWVRQVIAAGPNRIAISGRKSEPVVLRGLSSLPVVPTLHDAHQLSFNGTDYLLVNTGSNEVWCRRGGRLFAVMEAGGQQLKDPHSADLRRRDGALAIADTLNNRLVILEGDSVRCIHKINFRDDFSLSLSGPRVVRWLDSDCLLVADTGSRSIFSINLSGAVQWAVGHKNFSEVIPGMFRWQNSLFHDPRWVEVEPGGALLVSDTGNSRVLRLKLGSIVAQQM